MIPDDDCEVDSLSYISQGYKLFRFIVGVKVNSNEFGGSYFCWAQDFLFFNDSVVYAVKSLVLDLFFDHFQQSLRVVDRAYSLRCAFANSEVVFIGRDSHGRDAFWALKGWDKPLLFFISSVNHYVVAARVNYCIFVEEVQVTLDICVKPKHELGQCGSVWVGFMF